MGVMLVVVMSRTLRLSEGNRDESRWVGIDELMMMIMMMMNISILTCCFLPAFLFFRSRRGPRDDDGPRHDGDLERDADVVHHDAGTIHHDAPPRAVGRQGKRGPDVRGQRHGWYG